MIPEILNDIQVRRIQASGQDINLFKVKLPCSMFGSVLQVAVMLEIDAIGVQIMVVDGAEEVFRKDIYKHKTIHDPIGVM